jgi:hypothetical protein
MKGDYMKISRTVVVVTFVAMAVRAFPLTRLIDASS